METQKTASFLNDNHLLLPRDRELFKVVGQRNLDRTAIATCEIKQGEVIYEILPYSSKTEADFLSVQISTQEHIHDRLLEAMNHSCSPTTFVDVERMQVIAVRDISPGEEFTFFYPSTEWEMDRPFQCNCQSPECIGFVSGAKNLSISQIIQFQFNSFIKGLIRHSLNLD